MNKKKILISLTLSIVLIIVSFLVINAITLNTKSNENALLGKETKSDESTALEKEIKNNETINQVSTFITPNIKETAENIEVTAESNEEVTLQDLVDSTENIAIVRVISLDSSSAQYDHVVGNTYGKLMINTVIKGSLEEQQVIDYAALGGYLTIAEWEQYQPAAANEKRDFLRQQNGTTSNKNETYIHLQFKNNIDIEEGKTYIAYLNYNNQMGKYEIVGFADGLMELSIEKEDNNISLLNIDTNQVKIKNNYTSEYENLESYIEKVKSYINN